MCQGHDGQTGRKRIPNLASCHGLCPTAINRNRRLYSLQVIVSLAFLLCTMPGCVSPSATKTVPIPTLDGRKVLCTEPRPDVLVSSVAAEVSASIPKIKDALSVSATAQEAYTRIRAEVPGANHIELLHYRMCVEYANGAISKNDYSRFLQELLVPLQRNVSPENYSRPNVVQEDASMPYTTNAPLYGLTVDGVFFIHKALPEEVGGAVPELVAGFTEYNKHRIRMHLHGDYYIARSGITFSKLPIEYGFYIGKGKYIPHALIDIGSRLIDSNEVQYHKSFGGYNFVTTPLDRVDL